MRLVFAPIGILASLLAGLLARKGFERAWSVLDDEDPPEVETREVSYAKLAAALALEGATFRLVKGMVERGARIGFASLTGRWPGEEAAGG